jgi:EAL domain-containing protein (putative c-di-GMP-specific phosphodiesterase class I)
MVELDRLPPTTTVSLPRAAPRAGARMGAAQRRRLRRDLAGMAEGEGLMLRYQLRHSLLRGEPTGAEAAVCWPQRHRGMMSAPWDMPETERIELAIGVGGWALRTASQAASGWSSGDVSVAVAASQLRDHTLLTQVAEALDVSGLEPERLELSMSEAVAAEIGIDDLLTLSAIRDLGVGIALDDFGAGPASLSLLRRLPLTALKLARVLLRDVPGDREDSAIARAVVETAHALGLRVVADGIDCEPQLAFLNCCGCEEGQGALFGTKMAAEAIAAVM